MGPNVVAEQTRFLRSQQDLREKFENKGAPEDQKGIWRISYQIKVLNSTNISKLEAEVEMEPEIDPYSLIEPVEILSKLPKNFYDQIVSVLLVFSDLKIKVAKFQRKIFSANMNQIKMLILKHSSLLVLFVI